MTITTEFFSETGSEGGEYCLYDNTKSGYHGLIILEDGDFIKVYNDLDEIAWAGTIKKDYVSKRVVYPYWRKYINNLNGLQEDYPQIYSFIKSNLELNQYIEECHSQQCVGGLWVHWLQENVEHMYWHGLFVKELRAEITKK